MLCWIARSFGTATRGRLLPIIADWIVAAYFFFLRLVCEYTTGRIGPLEPSLSDVKKCIPWWRDGANMLLSTFSQLQHNRIDFFQATRGINILSENQKNRARVSFVHSR